MIGDFLDHAKYLDVPESQLVDPLQMELDAKASGDFAAAFAWHVVTRRAWISSHFKFEQLAIA